MRSRREGMGLFGNEKKPLSKGRYSEVQYVALDVSDSKDAPHDLDPGPSKGKQLRSAALIVSWISVIFSFASGVAAVVIGQMFDSESMFGYGLDGILDSLSSVAVLWRFYGTTSSIAAEAKERKACIIISFFFFISAGSLIFKSVRALLKDEREEESERILVDAFSLCCGVITLILASIKVYIGRRINSRSLITDSIITYVGSAMSFLGVIGLEVHRAYNDVWYLDPAFGALCGVFLCAFGFKLLIEMTCLYRNHHQSLSDGDT